MRRKPHEDHVNHEAWAIPYADLMTLLLAFFVVMYAVSVVNEGKYRVMSRSIMEAFGGSGHVIAVQGRPGTDHDAAAVAPVPGGAGGVDASPVALPIPLHPDHRPAADVPARPTPAPAAAGNREVANLSRIRDEVTAALAPLIARQQVIVRPSRNWLEIELRTDILFPSGVAQLSGQADAILARLAGILAPFDNPLRIEGYTDDRPISTTVYPSNWELSAARAASVARLFADHGVHPGRMGIVGWGQFRPAADNATAEGRNRNRRVLVVVLGDGMMPERYAGETPGAATHSPASTRSAAPTVVVTPEQAR